MIISKLKLKTLFITNPFVYSRCKPVCPLHFSRLFGYFAACILTIWKNLGIDITAGSCSCYNNLRIINQLLCVLLHVNEVPEITWISYQRSKYMPETWCKIQSFWYTSFKAFIWSLKQTQNWLRTSIFQNKNQAIFETISGFFSFNWTYGSSLDISDCNLFMPYSVFKR